MYQTNDIEYSNGELIEYIDLNKNDTWEINFSDANNAWYKEERFHGTALEVLDHVDTYLHDKENKMYNVWIYRNGNWVFRELGENKIGRIVRSQRVRKFLNKL